MAKETICLVNAKKMTVPEERMDMYDAFEILEKENKRLLVEKSQGACTVNLYDKKDNLLFSEDVVFPLENDIEVVLSERFFAPKESSIVKPNKQIQVTKDPKPKKERKQKSSKEKIEKSEPSFMDTETTNKSIIQKSLLKGQKRMVLLLVGAVCLLTVGGILVQSFPLVESAVQWFSKSEPEKSWNDYLEEKNYIGAGKKFPEKLGDLVDYLTENQEFKALKELNETFPTAEATFDLAFYQKEWEEVIGLNDSKLTKERQVMLAHSYIELGRLTEAEILNKTLKSKILTNEIHFAYKIKAIKLIQAGKIDDAAAIQKKINDDELEELLATGKACLEMIEHYKKENDSESQKQWVSRLENLGGEIIHESTKNNK